MSVTRRPITLNSLDWLVTFGARSLAAPFFNSLTNTVYFFARKRLYVPLRLSPEGTE